MGATLDTGKTYDPKTNTLDLSGAAAHGTWMAAEIAATAGVAGIAMGARAGLEGAAEGITAETSALTNASRAAENLSASNEALEHVLGRHAFGSPATNAGKFAANADIPGLIRNTVSNGLIRPGNAANPSAIVFEQFLSSPVGVTRAGVDALGVRVVLDPNGALITAFPF